MRTPLYCDNPLCWNEIGTMTTYEWGDDGCDPPDYDFDSDAVEDETGVYCSTDCQEFVNEKTEEECEN